MTALTKECVQRVREGAVANTGIPDKTRTVEMTILKSAPFNDSVGEKQKRKAEHQASRTAGRDRCPEQLKSPRCVTLRASQRLATQDSHLHDKRTRQRLLNRPFKRTRASDLTQLAGVRAAHSVWRPKTKDLAKTASLKMCGTCENRRRQSHWALRLDQPAPRAARRGAMRCPLRLVCHLA